MYHVRKILDFLSDLAVNNHTEWFRANRSRYDEARNDFIALTQEWLDELVKIEPALQPLSPKDCIWRINRDIRFSADKSPYKNHFGAFPAMPQPGKPASSGGKKSDRGGYYLHLQPGACMFAAGIWNPAPNLLNALRKEVYANYEEIEQLFAQPRFKRFFGSDFDHDWMMKKVPAGFPKDFVHADWLKHRNYLIVHYLSDEQVCQPDFMDLLMQLSRTAKPLNDFLNYTFEEYNLE